MSSTAFLAIHESHTYHDDGNNLHFGGASSVCLGGLLSERDQLDLANLASLPVKQKIKAPPSIALHPQKMLEKHQVNEMFKLLLEFENSSGL